MGLLYGSGFRTYLPIEPTYWRHLGITPTQQGYTADYLNLEARSVAHYLLDKGLDKSLATEVINDLKTVVKGLVDLYEMNHCAHESLTRGGIQWTICEDCGMKWADDEGGFEPKEVPDIVNKAYEVMK